MHFNQNDQQDPSIGVIDEDRIEEARFDEPPQFDHEFDRDDHEDVYEERHVTQPAKSNRKAMFVVVGVFGLIGVSLIGFVIWAFFMPHSRSVPQYGNAQLAAAMQAGNKPQGQQAQALSQENQRLINTLSNNQTAQPQPAPVQAVLVPESSLRKAPVPAQVSMPAPQPAQPVPVSAPVQTQAALEQPKPDANAGRSSDVGIAALAQSVNEALAKNQSLIEGMQSSIQQVATQVGDQSALLAKQGQRIDALSKTVAEIQHERRPVAKHAIERPTPRPAKKAPRTATGWTLAGMGGGRAMVVAPDGRSYLVSIGDELPELGRVVSLDIQHGEVVTASAVIRQPN